MLSSSPLWNYEGGPGVERVRLPVLERFSTSGIALCDLLLVRGCARGCEVIADLFDADCLNDTTCLHNQRLGFSTCMSRRSTFTRQEGALIVTKISKPSRSSYPSRALTPLRGVAPHSLMAPCRRLLLPALPPSPPWCSNRQLAQLSSSAAQSRMQVSLPSPANDASLSPASALGRSWLPRPTKALPTTAGNPSQRGQTKMLQLWPQRSPTS